MCVPMVMPRLFREVFERTVAVHDGDMLVERQKLMDIGARLTALYGENPVPYETTLVTVATEFFHDGGARACYLARANALSLLFANEELMAAWADAGWVRRSATDPDRFAPVWFVIEAAAICPLDEVAPGFGLIEFHAAAYCRAVALGLGF